MRGASALQRLLDDLPDKRVRAFIVWEPVLATDVGPPTTQVLSQIKDPRAEQWWDRKHLLSDRVSKAARNGVRAFAGLPAGQVAWDLVGVYPPGATWVGEVPAPAYCGNPVVDTVDSLRARLGGE